MQNSYEEFVQNNRQLLVNKAIAKDVLWTTEDLSDIRSPQLLLDMMADEFLDAAKAELFSLQDIKNVYIGFYEFYIARISQHRNPRLVFEGVMQHDDCYILEGAGLAHVKAEEDMRLLFAQLTSRSSLDALRAGTYDMSSVSQKARNFGPKAVYLIDPDFLTALDEQRITMDNVTEMSCQELSTAISENRYPQDSSYGCN